jgi:uncharacterized membrane protein YphA (DoxX/SURF4 family)
MDRSAQTRPLIEMAGRIVLAAVFIYAGVVKALDPAAFAQSIDGYRLLPYPAGVALALYLPWIEIAGGAGVLWPRARLGALALLFLLCLVFGMAVASAWVRDLNIGCGCFGGGGIGADALRGSLIRSAGLALLAGGLLWLEEARCVGMKALPPTPGTLSSSDRR